jgi:hypothetical protein
MSILMGKRFNKHPDYDPVAVSKLLKGEDKRNLKKAFNKAKILKLVVRYRKAKRQGYADSVYKEIKLLLSML